MKSARLLDMELYISKNNVSSLEELRRHYNVSLSTIRRDVFELVRRKKFHKVYGGVMASSQAKAEAEKPERMLLADPARNEIGKIAASLVEDGMSIFLDSGITTLQILPHIAKKKDITVISHSLPALCEAAKYPSLLVIALGGVYDRTSSSFVGSNTLNELSKMSIDLVFLATTGATIELGLTNPSYSDIEVKKSVMKWNQNIVLMADHSKFGRNALMSFCDFKDIGVIITDRPLNGEFRKANSLSHIRVLTPQTDDLACAGMMEE